MKMRASLLYIELENFKSYKGKHRIGPLEAFNAVIGLNGSGKSNFMDAVCFVMGEKPSSLRAKRLADLIHGSHIEQPISHSCSVTATFLLEDGSEKHFQRTVQRRSSDYHINEESVSEKLYLSELKILGINIRAKNFIIYQGSVDSIAMKNPEEYSMLIEEISGSGALKEEYERCQLKVTQADEEIKILYQQKRALTAKSCESKFANDEAVHYTLLEKTLESEETNLQLFKLYHIEKSITIVQAEYQYKQVETRLVERKKTKDEEILGEKKKYVGILQRDLAKIEQDIREVEVETFKKEPTLIKAKELVTHNEKKLETAQKTLQQAKKANEAHQADIQKLTVELCKIEEAKAEWEATVAEQSQSRGSSVQLEEAQVHKYEYLKKEATMKSTPYLQELDSINCEQRADQDQLDNEICKKSKIENKLRQKGHEKAAVAKRIDKLAEHIRTVKNTLDEQRQIRDELQTVVGEGRDLIKQIQDELETVSSQLGDIHVDKFVDSKKKKKQEVFESFKSSIPGIYDRIINMCQPIHNRYNIAISKALGKYTEAIVVDTEKTARKCIQILRARMSESEIFLPLDFIETQPLNETLRDIKDPENVKLLFDVLQFDPAIHKAVLLVTRNILVCETPEDASRVVYDLDHKNAVALDGTFYQESGIISGGNFDLARKTKCWDKKQISQLKSREEKLTEQLRELMKKSRKESELTTVIRGIESKLKYAETQLENSMKQIPILEKEIAALEKKMEEYDHNISDIEQNMQNRDQKILEIKEQINNVEDTVFNEFCRDIGVVNIRQYEEKELKIQQERAKKRTEFDSQIDRISSYLEFENSRDTKENVERWVRNVQDADDALNASRLAESEKQKKIDVELECVKQLKSECQAKCHQIEQMEGEIKKARREVGNLTKEVEAIQKQISSILSKFESKINDRHQLLKECKSKGIFIPLTHGSLDDIINSGNSLVDNSTTQLPDTMDSLEIYERESRILIDYESLSEDLRDLDEPDDIQKQYDLLEKSVLDLQQTLDKIPAPNMRAKQTLEELHDKINVKQKAIVSAHKKARQARMNFERVKKERCNKFNHCLNHIANEIDSIYKSLAMNDSAQAFLGSLNPEEPYLDGINYSCIAPGKRFQPMYNLSGGEKTVAALALLFALHSYQPAPFFLLDEVDGYLDNTNIFKLAHYINEKNDNIQIIVISLREILYSRADLLIGVSLLPDDPLASDILTLNFKDLSLN